jgi:hypothetical protein
MASTGARRQRTPHPATRKGGLKQAAITKDGRRATTQQRTLHAASQTVEPNPSTITEDDVRRRAYELYVERGNNPGDEVSDWLQAERELLSDQRTVQKLGSSLT